MDRRKKELLNLIEGKEVLRPLVDDAIFLEERLETLRKLPFIRVNPKNPEQQKTTPAQKQYKELLQQYTNVIKVIAKTTGEDEKNEESPLRKWAKKHVNKRNEDMDAG